MAVKQFTAEVYNALPAHSSAAVLKILRRRYA